jgi:hypothetical protein
MVNDERDINVVRVAMSLLRETAPVKVGGF